MVNVSVARRYARALLEASGAAADEVLAQLEAVVAFLEQNEGIFAALSSPALARTQRMAITEALINASAGAKPVLANLMRLLTDRNRFAILPNLARLFREQVDVKLGRVRGQVTSAVPMQDAQLSALKAQLEAMTQKKVILESSTDASLLGGVVAHVGGRVFDGSLKSQLHELGKKLGAPVR